MPEQVRLAMWSGPRNISTAMMRSWDNRGDTTVIDEPFYGFYLYRTGKHHPGSAEIVSQTEIDVSKIVATLTGPVPGGKRIFYQKHMTHHLLPEVDRSWLAAVTNCFLIRDPAEVITSYLKKNPDPRLEDLGYVQQAELFDLVRRNTGAIPPVIDARDVLENPRRLLHLLCRALGINFDDAMLSWSPGLRETDGVWAKYWYGEVAQSTCFEAYRPRNEPVPAAFRDVYERCVEHYRKLHRHRLI
jgi:hypothetical protein